MRLLGCAALCLGLTFVSSAAAVELEEIDEALKKPIIGAALSLEEVQQFTEQRVPKMPELGSAEAWRQQAERLRRQVLDDVVFRGAARTWRDAQTRVEWGETLEAGPGYKIRKLRYEAVPGLWAPALLYEPDKLEGKHALALNVNGHDRQGKAAEYKQLRCINQAKRGMIVLNVEWLGMGQLNVPGLTHYKMNQLDLCGTSGIAPFYLAMKRGIDVLLSHEHADPKRLAVAGLSGGGWQTIFISSLDTRVTLSNPVAGYSSFVTRARHLKDLGDSEQTPSDLATVADYNHLTAMLAPRPALLTFNAKDQCCFEAGYALPPLVQASGPVYELLGRGDYLRTHVNHDPGTHNFEKDNRQALYRILGDHFFAEDKNYSAEEIPSADEVLTSEQLAVELPPDNATFNSLAKELIGKLPRTGTLPTAKEAALAWQDENRKLLAELVSFHDYQCRPQEPTTTEADGIKITHYPLRISGDWTVPAVEFTPADATETVILISDEGRAGTADEVAAHLKASRRVLAVDPFYFGESKIAQRDFLFALLVAAVGERPLGIQASQLAAVARWAKQEHGEQPVRLIAHGRRLSTAALVAAALEPEALDGVEVHQAMGSLKQVVEQDLAANQTPELFCFGLLQRLDLVHIAALSAPRPVTFNKPDDRIRQEMAPLKGWYKTLGKEHEALR